jgi:Fur family iron response transcriptional regulator
MSHQDILDKFAKHTILPTPQRLEVAKILLEKPQHLSAEQIIDRLRENGSTVSKATVYNTLNLFGERGLVKELSVDPERRFYDSTTHAHHHFYNVDTGELRDIADSELALSAMPALPEGTVADGVEILVKVRNG